MYRGYFAPGELDPSGEITIHANVSAKFEGGLGSDTSIWAVIDPANECKCCVSFFWAQWAKTQWWRENRSQKWHKVDDWHWDTEEEKAAVGDVKYEYQETKKFGGTRLKYEMTDSPHFVGHQGPGIKTWALTRFKQDFVAILFCKTDKGALKNLAMVFWGHDWTRSYSRIPLKPGEKRRGPPGYRLGKWKVKRYVRPSTPFEVDCP
jgi:hypothetical protein